MEEARGDRAVDSSGPTAEEAVVSSVEGEDREEWLQQRLSTPSERETERQDE